MSVSISNLKNPAEAVAHENSILDCYQTSSTEKKTRDVARRVSFIERLVDGSIDSGYYLSATKADQISEYEESDPKKEIISRLDLWIRPSEVKALREAEKRDGVVDEEIEENSLLKLAVENAKKSKKRGSLQELVIKAVKAGNLKGVEKLLKDKEAYLRFLAIGAAKERVTVFKEMRERLENLEEVGIVNLKFGNLSVEDRTLSVIKAAKAGNLEHVEDLLNGGEAHLKALVIQIAKEEQEAFQKMGEALKGRKSFDIFEQNRAMRWAKDNGLDSLYYVLLSM